jgi:hypothetical protein
MHNNTSRFQGGMLFSDFNITDDWISVYYLAPLRTTLLYD